ncbi:MAG: hypothetical protein ACYDAY_05955 [Candidatus Dormibacteria bacterium]
MDRFPKSFSDIPANARIGGAVAIVVILSLVFAGHAGYGPGFLVSLAGGTPHSDLTPIEIAQASPTPYSDLTPGPDATAPGSSPGTSRTPGAGGGHASPTPVYSMLPTAPFGDYIEGHLLANDSCRGARPGSQCHSKYQGEYTMSSQQKGIIEIKATEGTTVIYDRKIQPVPYGRWSYHDEPSYTLVKGDEVIFQCFLEKLDGTVLSPGSISGYSIAQN